MLKNLQLLFLLCLAFIVKGQTPANDPNWSSTLIINEDFNGTAGSLPNPAIWRPDRGYNDYVASQDIGFTFSPPGNASLDGNSNLILKTEYVSTDPIGRYLHSGAINSKTSTYGYGYYEIRCKLNSYSMHFMPAFWLWSGNNCNCPAPPATQDCTNGWYNENDFFETICEPNHFNITNNVHHYAGNCTNNWGQTSSHFINSNDLFTYFHTYGYEWSPGRIIFYLDGEPYKYFYSPYVANHPLSIAVTLGWNNLDASFYNELAALPPTSRQMTIDYIKVYDLKRNCIDVTYPNFNSGSFTDFTVKKSITINGTSSISSPHAVTLRAQDGITVSGDFTVNLGSELLLLPTGCY